LVNLSFCRLDDFSSPVIVSDSFSGFVIFSLQREALVMSVLGKRIVLFFGSILFFAFQLSIISAFASAVVCFFPSLVFHQIDKISDPSNLLPYLKRIIQ